MATNKQSGNNPVKSRHAKRTHCRRRTGQHQPTGTSKLRKALDPYLTVATKVGRTGSTGRLVSRAAQPARSNRDQNQAIREWAVKNGYEVSERGRIPTTIVEAFHAKRLTRRHATVDVEALTSRHAGAIGQLLVRA